MDSVSTHDEESPLVVNDLQFRNPKNYARDIHILSWAFLLIFLAYGAAQNLESTVNNVGFFPFCFPMKLNYWIYISGRKLRGKRLVR